MNLRLLSLLVLTFMLCASSTGFAWTLLWNANSASQNVISYRIYERFGAVYEFVGTTTASPSPSFVLPPLSNGTHIFVVTAVNPYGESSHSNETTITIGPTPTPSPPPAPVGGFVKGINVNGGTVVVNGNQWLSFASALSQGFSTNNATFSNQHVYSPSVDNDTNTMLRTGTWCSSCDVNFSQTLPNADYDVYLWMIEDYQSYFRASNVQIQGAQVGNAVGQMPLYTWQRYGPYRSAVSNGVLSVRLARTTGDPLVQGVEIWTAGASAPTPTPTPPPPPAPTQVSQLTKGGIKCNEFHAGTAPSQTTVTYTVGSNGKIGETNPAKFTYWVKVVAPVGNNTFVINQSITTGNFATQFKLKPASAVYKAGDCKAAGGLDFNQNTTSGASSTVVVKFNAPTAGTFYIALKFRAKNMKSQTAPSPAAPVHYNFSTTGVPDSARTLELRKQ